MNLTWENQTNLPDGHRLFDAVGHLRVSGRCLTAIADDSGDYPQDTDDGVIWLDFRRDLSVGTTCFIPCYDADSEPVNITTDAATIMCLSSKYDWRVNVLGTIFKAMKI